MNLTEALVRIEELEQERKWYRRQLHNAIISIGNVVEDFKALQLVLLKLEERPR